MQLIKDFAVTRDMPGEMLGYATFLSQSFECSHTTFIDGDRKHSAILAQTTVLLHNLLGIVKQLDIGFRSCLLSMDYYPFTPRRKIP